MKAATGLCIEGISSLEPFRPVFVCSRDLLTLRSHWFGTCRLRDALRNVLGFLARSSPSLAVETQIPAGGIQSDAAWTGEAQEQTLGAELKGQCKLNSLHCGSAGGRSSSTTTRRDVATVESNAWWDGRIYG